MQKQFFTIRSIFVFVCLFVGIALLSFTLYLIPNAYFNANYDIPTFIAHLRVWLSDQYGVPAQLQMLLILLPMIIIGLCLLYVAGLLSSSSEKPTETEAAPAKSTPTMRAAAPQEFSTRELPSQSLSYLQNSPKRPKKYVIHPVIFHLLAVAIVLFLLAFAEWFLLFGMKYFTLP